MRLNADYYPAGGYILGVPSPVHHWEVRSGRVTVEYKDGLRLKSWRRPSDFDGDVTVRECSCPRGEKSTCGVHGS